MVKNRLASFMEKLGFEAGSEPSSYLRFHAWSVANQEKFYEAAIDDIGFHWITKPKSILAYKDGDPIWRATWFIGGEANVYDMCIEQQIARGRGDRLALISRREDGATVKLTFEEVRARVEELAARLIADGVVKGDRVCVIMPSCVYSYIAFYALQKIGATFVPIPTEVMDLALVKRLRLARPRMVITVDGFVYGGKRIAVVDGVKSAVDEAASEIGKPTVVCVGYLDDDKLAMDGVLGYSSWMSGPKKNAATARMSSTDITMILFTSGTTGTPKGTMHTYAAAIEDMLENAYASNINAGDRFLWYTSPGWMMFPWLVTGTNGLGATTVFYDGSLTVNGRDTLLGLVEEFGLTHIGIAPPLIGGVIDALTADPERMNRIGSLREIRYTSAPLADSIADRLAALGYPPNGACGGTDGCFCYSAGNPVTRRTGATMLPGLGIDLHVVVLDGAAYRDARPGEMGDVVIERPFPSMTRGLLGDDEARSRFRRTYFTGENGAESKYWMHGDLASFDDNGYLTVHGRVDDLLVVHGNKLSPMDVQEAVLASNAEVSDAAAVTMPVRPGDGGELFVFAVLRPDASAMGHEELDRLKERIAASVKERVNKLAKPYMVAFVSGIPYTINNKPALRIIRSAFSGQTVGDTSTIRNPRSIEELAELGRRFRAGTG